MAGLREIKSRIKSVKETKQITKAMKLISASKLKKARAQLEKTMPFFKTIEKTMADILLHSGSVESKYFDDGKKKKEKPRRAYFVLTGDKGLAGGYNSNLYKLTEQHIGKDKDALLFVAGHMGRAYFSRKKYNVHEDFDFPVQNPSVTRARDISDILLQHYTKGEIDEIYMVVTFMISSIRLEPRIIKLLPLDVEELRKVLGVPEGQEIQQDSKLSFEPSPEAVFDILVPKYIKGIVYCALVEAFTSEQSARMTAMDNATNNATEMLANLKLHFNRARQAAITQEISEIVGGAAVLE